jgi:hypothetical protein
MNYCGSLDIPTAYPASSKNVRSTKLVPHSNISFCQRHHIKACMNSLSPYMILKFGASIFALSFRSADAHYQA